MKIDEERKINKYFVTIPVSSWQIAKLFGSRTNWKILKTLREAGIRGLTVEELAKKTRIPKSTVYNVLSKLEAGEWVESGELRREEPSWGRPRKEVTQRSGGKPPMVYIERVPWGAHAFDPDFIDSLEPLLEKYKDNLKKIWLAFLGEIVEKYKTDKELEEFLPKDPIHEECGRSHEAIEFFYAISTAMIEEIFEDADFEELARKHKFMK